MRRLRIRLGLERWRLRWLEVLISRAEGVRVGRLKALEMHERRWEGLHLLVTVVEVVVVVVVDAVAVLVVNSVTVDSAGG